MKRTLLVLAFGVFCWSILAGGRALAWGWYDGSPGAPWWEFDTRFPGLLVISQPGQRITSVGGIFTPRKVTVTETDGPVPVTSTFVYPSAFHSPSSVVNLKYAHGAVKVLIPDQRGLLYVDGNPTPLRGPVQVLKTPLMQAGQTHVYRLRAAFRSGDKLLIEDGKVTVPAGQAFTVAFKGTNAIAVRLPAAAPKSDKLETAPLPRRVPADR